MSPPVLRIVQLNAGSLLEPGWDQRRIEIAAWLDHLQPDVVCLQEIWEDATHENTARWLVDRVALDHWAFGGSPFDERAWPDPSTRFGSAVLSRWPVDAWSYHRLPLDADPDSLARAVPWELLHVRTAGLDVFSTHLAPAPQHGRHRQLQVVAISELIATARRDRDTIVDFGHRREAMPAILCGDFNAEPDSDDIRFLSGFTRIDGHDAFFQDAWRVAGEGTGLTQDWRGNPIAADLNVHRKRIDYVFVGDPFRRAGDAGRVVRAELAFHHPLTGVVASDHAGLVVDVVWPARPS